MKQIAGIAIVTIMLVGCSNRVAPKRTTFAAPEALIVAKAGPSDVYPEVQLTPGVTNPNVTQANIQETICKSGWTATVRPPASYTNNLKKEGITQYGYDDSKLADYEEDHFIPLEIGGNPKDPGNLWPEPYDTKVSGKTIGAQHFSIIVASGSTSVLKQGSRVPVGTNTSSAGSNEVTYLDLGQEIQASLDGYLDGVRLRTKLVQSGIAEEKSVIGSQDPVIRQTTLEGTSTLVQGKPLVLGSLDVPGSTRHQEVAVVSELVR